MEEQHIYNHEIIELSVDVKVEKLTKGYNYTASVHNAKSVDEAMEILKDAEMKLKMAYGSSV